MFLGWSPDARYSESFLQEAHLLHWNGPFKPWNYPSVHLDLWERWFIPDPSGKFSLVRPESDSWGLWNIPCMSQWGTWRRSSLRLTWTCGGRCNRKRTVNVIQRNVLENEVLLETVMAKWELYVCLIHKMWLICCPQQVTDTCKDVRILLVEKRSKWKWETQNNEDFCVFVNCFYVNLK